MAGSNVRQKNGMKLTIFILSFGLMKESPKTMNSTLQYIHYPNLPLYLMPTNLLNTKVMEMK